MCIASVIYDYTRENDFTKWRSPDFRIWEDLLKKAKEFDTITGQPNCEDPEKAKLELKIQLYKKKCELLEQIAEIDRQLAEFK